jgi:predicted phage terminase large subunit-like protein
MGTFGATLFDDIADELEQSGEGERWPLPGDLAAHISPRTVRTPALALIDQALLDAVEGRHRRLIVTMPPQEGKSERISRTLPAWLLHRNPDLRIASVSATDGLSRRWGRAVRNDITMHPELGLRVASDTAAANEWRIEGRDGGMITTSIRGTLVGRPVDVLIIDDPISDQQEADSETMREHVKEWWRSVGSNRLPENAIVIVVQTRWHDDDLAGWLYAGRDEDTGGPDVWRLLNIPAQADHDPGRGETDILGREPGEYMVSARGRTREGWELRKRDAGSRAWSALFQGRPSPQDGGIFKRGWFRYYDTPRAVQRSDGTWFAAGADQVWISVDAAFKDTKSSDFVVMQVWAKRGARAWLLDQVCDRMDFPRTCTELINLSAIWPQAVGKLIEDKANGTAVLQSLFERVSGMIAVTPTEKKEARAHAITPLLEAGSVEFPAADIHPWIVKFVDECVSFPNAAHDDQVDGMTQLLKRLFLDGDGNFMEQLLREQQGGAHGAQHGTRAWSPQDIDPDSYGAGEVPLGLPAPWES